MQQAAKNRQLDWSSNVKKQYSTQRKCLQWCLVNWANSLQKKKILKAQFSIYVNIIFQRKKEKMYSYLNTT